MHKNTVNEPDQSTTAKLTDYQQILLQRIHNIAVSLMLEFEDKNKAMDAVVLDDGSLLQLLCSIQMEQKTRVSDCEMRKVRRRRENLEEFYKSLQELGGVLKVNDVADVLGITRQAVNVRVKKNQLIAFKQNGDFIFPVFQFTNQGLIPGFKDIMAAFDRKTHPMLRLGVLNTPINVGKDVLKTPIQILQDGADSNELRMAIRVASQFGNHIAS
ncbi:MAG: DNA-binding protein [Enterobacter asburiae]|jgi:hypothetical protein|nr:DNA-binding protein [Enterobacter asburiae]